MYQFQKDFTCMSTVLIFFFFLASIHYSSSGSVFRFMKGKSVKQNY